MKNIIHKFYWTASGRKFCSQFLNYPPRKCLDFIKSEIIDKNMTDFKLWIVNRHEADGTIYNLYFAEENCPFSYFKNY